MTKVDPHAVRVKFLNCVSLVLKYTTSSTENLCILSHPNQGLSQKTVKGSPEGWGLGVLPQCNLVESGDIFYVQAENRPFKRRLDGSLAKSLIPTYISLLRLKGWFTSNNWLCRCYYMYRMATVRLVDISALAVNITDTFKKGLNQNYFILVNSCRMVPRYCGAVYKIF